MCYPLSILLKKKPIVLYTTGDFGFLGLRLIAVNLVAMFVIILGGFGFLRSHSLKFVVLYKNINMIQL
jgi:hypothetical protein